MRTPQQNLLNVSILVHCSLGPIIFERVYRFRYSGQWQSDEEWDFGDRTFDSDCI